eukprot:scaffold17409_cov27-Prasinocladus_malaysianus.AAC.1
MSRSHWKRNRDSIAQLFVECSYVPWGGSAGVQPQGGDGQPGGGAHQPSLRPAASGSRRPHGPRQVLPAVHGERLQERDAPHGGARDPADQSGHDGAHPQGHGNQRPPGV